MAANRKDEELLEGGNVSTVYKVGNTVRREIKPESSKVHSLLKHLENKGYAYSPHYLGIDEKNREILSYIEGEAGHTCKEYMWSNEALTNIAIMLRQYHDSVRDFPFEGWQSIDHTPKKNEVLCHNDFALYNLIFKDQMPTGIIDFDVAGPGPRIWDIAYTVYTCVPLSRFHYRDGIKLDYDSIGQAANKQEKIRLFFQVYGMTMPDDFKDMILLRLKGLCTTISRKAHEGDQAFQKMISEGHIEHYQKDIAFIQNHWNEWI
ncbi:phosphotransferase [Metabacillus sp. HB246100]